MTLQGRILNFVFETGGVYILCHKVFKNGANLCRTLNGYLLLSVTGLPPTIQ